MGSSPTTRTMKKIISEVAENFLDAWENDRIFFFLMCFASIFATAMFVVICSVLIALFIAYTKVMFIIFAALLVLLAVPVSLTLYGKHIKANP